MGLSHVSVPIPISELQHVYLHGIPVGEWEYPMYQFPNYMMSVPMGKMGISHVAVPILVPELLCVHSHGISIRKI